MEPATAEAVTYGIWGRRGGPSSGKAQKGMLPPLPVDGARRDRSSSIPSPSARLRHGEDPMGTHSSLNTLRCPTGRCWVWGALVAEPIWPSSPPQNTHWQKQARQPTAPAAHMHGLIGTGEPRAPAHAADAPRPREGTLLGHLPAPLPPSSASPPQPPGSPRAAAGKRGTPAPVLQGG